MSRLIECRIGLLASITMLALLLPIQAHAEEKPLFGAELQATPYVYQNSGQGDEMSVRLQYELGYGSRENRNFTQEGVEQGVRARFQPLDRVAVEAFGGVVIAQGGRYEAASGSFELIGRALCQDGYYVNLDLGAGYIYDYRGDHIPRVRLTLGHSFDKLDVSLMGLLEVPVGSAGRDEMDVMTSLALSYAFMDTFRLGIEAAGEDLEGLVEAEEAEGGAKLLFGPTAGIELPYDLFIKLNAAAVYAYVNNQVYLPGQTKPDTWGFMGRMALGWSWR